MNPGDLFIITKRHNSTDRSWIGEPLEFISQQEQFIACKEVRRSGKPFPLDLSTVDIVPCLPEYAATFRPHTP